jgi:hypothetical protein
MMEARRRAAEEKARQEEEERRRAAEAAAAKAEEIRQRRAMEKRHAVRIQGTVTISRPPEVDFFPPLTSFRIPFISRESSSSNHRLTVYGFLEWGPRFCTTTLRWRERVF